MTEPRITRESVNGMGMEVRHWPEPTNAANPPVVILHGVLQTSGGMRHLAERLATDGEVVAPDLRGRGGTDKPDSGYDPASMAEDVGALMESMGLAPAVVIGRLHGGLVAYHLAARRPELVRGVVLGNASPDVSTERAARVLARVNAIPREFASLEDAQRFYEETLGLSTERVKSDLPIDLEPLPDGRYRWRHDLGIVARIEAAATPRADWHVLGRVRCPMLLLRGQRGELSAEVANRVLEVVPNSKAQVIHGAGPDVFLGPGSEQTLAAIQLFLRGVGRN